MNKNKIDNEKYYSMNSIIILDLIPWIKSVRTLRRWIEKDNTVLKANIVGSKTARRYYIKGEHIITIVEKAKKGQI